MQLTSFTDMLSQAEQKGYAVGSFSPRYTPLIRAIFRAGMRLRSPLLIQISQIELQRAGISLETFVHDFRQQWEQDRPDIPVGLHLDHTYRFELIEEAIRLGFSSVMIDASAQSLEENAAITREVVEFAHARRVSVEAELGRIGTADFMETDTDVELFTDPDEARWFVQETGVDALAVSVGTAHGVYSVRQPRVDVERLQEIRRRTPVHLVLHGGSGTPAGLIRQAIHLPGGGVSKINIATDLDQAALQALGLSERPTNERLRAYPPVDLEPALRAVQGVVEEKMRSFLGSAGAV